MKKIFELSRQQMREITGGGGPEQASHNEEVHHCFIDGELIFETICTTDEQCQNVYGKEAKCY